MDFPISILDQSPIVAGSTPADAVAATIALARRADALGYHRYWLAEHHAMGGLADASPEVLLARLTAETSRIRLGTGGIMLPHYAALKVAESFRMLEALAPGRIDLGVGRAPGGTQRVSIALESNDPRAFADQIDAILRYFRDEESLVAMPSGASSPMLWVLGSSEFGALLAAERGLPYVYAHFIGGDAPEIAHAYRARFRPSRYAAEPQLIVAAAAMVAPSVDEAEELALPVALWRMRLLRGMSGPVPSVEDAAAYPWTPRERHEVALTRRLIAGDPASVRARIDELVSTYRADEAMIVTIAPDYASRARSYELLAFAGVAVA